MTLKVRTSGGEGKSARDALRALATALKNEEVDEDGTLVIRVQRARVKALGDSPGYDGFLAEVTSAPGREGSAGTSSTGRS
jgi:hypothetical protein